MSEDTPAAPGQIEVGSRLAGYRCEEKIGHGGMAVVYRAYDDHLDRRVALKVLAPELARDEVFRARFIQESRIAAATEHPNIIPVFNAGEADGVLYIAMRYVPDGDVRSLIDRIGPLPVARACALIAQAASALDAAHARGLVHRDVKPTNMLLEVSNRSSRPDHLYLSDFGLAKPQSAATGLTMTGQFFGTVDYVAPEQIQGQPLDGRADQYALACATFEMLCGIPPFKRETGMAVISAHISDPPPSLAARRPELPPAVDQVIAKALSKSPADRYERCMDFAEALLAAYRSGLPGPGQAAAGTPHPPTQVAMPVAPVTVADAGAAGPGNPGTRAVFPAPATPPGAGAPLDPGPPTDTRAAAGTGGPGGGPGMGGPGGGPGMGGHGGGPGMGGAAGMGAAAAMGAAAGPGAPQGSSVDPSIVPGFQAAQPPPPSGWPPAGEQPTAMQPGSPTAGPWGGQQWPPPDQEQWSPSGQEQWPGQNGWSTPPRRRRSRTAVVVGVLAGLVAVFLVAAGVSYFVLRGNGTPASGPSPAITQTVTASPSTATSPATPSTTANTPPPAGGPAATVQAYYKAINDHRYARAWRLGGKNTGSTYSDFVAGYAGTAQDTVTIQSVNGNTVTATLSAQQTDGTIKTYQGTYVVTNGVITQFNVQQTG